VIKNAPAGPSPGAHDKELFVVDRSRRNGHPKSTPSAPSGPHLPPAGSDHLYGQGMPRVAITPWPTAYQMNSRAF